MSEGVGGTSSTKELAASKRSPRMPFGDIMERLLFEASSADPRSPGTCWERCRKCRSSVAPSTLGSLSISELIPRRSCSAIRSNFILHLLSVPFRIDGKREFESKRFVSAGRNYNKISFDSFVEKFVKEKIRKEEHIFFSRKRTRRSENLWKNR